MSVTGDSTPAVGGLDSVPAENMPATEQGQMPRSGADAALSPAGAATDAGTSEAGDQPEGITAEQIRALGHFTREDFNRATANLTRKQAEASQQAHQFRSQYEQAQAWGEQLQNLLAEQGVDQEELENLRMRFERDQEAQRQSAQQEAQQFAAQAVQQETQRAIQVVQDAAYDENGRQLFDPQDPEITKAGQLYLQWVNYAAANQSEDNMAEMQKAGRYFRQTIYKVLRQSLASQGQSQPGQGQQAPQAPPERGRQVAGMRGGSGTAGVKDVHANALAAGQSNDDAFLAAMRAAFSS